MMNKTEWKSLEEIDYSLKNYEKLAVLSCTVCAMFSGTGGKEGIKIFRKLCSRFDKTIVFSRCITPCCSEEVMGRALSVFRKKIEKADALVILSCASGIKAANLTALSVPVVSVLNPVGSVVLASGKSNSKLIDSICTVCGKCVLTYTAGICPIHECPAKSVYAPCKKAPPEGGACVVKPEQDCVWYRIKQSGDPEALKGLRYVHAKDDNTRIDPVEVKHANALIKWPVAMFLTIAQFCEKCVRWIQ